MPRRDAAHSPQADPEVVAFLRGLDHPLKREIEQVRRIVLGVSPRIRAGIKWNSLSFRTTEWFATIHLRSRETLQLVFHLGAKVKDGSTGGLRLEDPAGLVKWLAKERCLVTLGAGKEIAAHRSAFAAIVRAWIAQMGAGP